jgi:hypothetical protein
MFCGLKISKKYFHVHIIYENILLNIVSPKNIVIDLNDVHVVKIFNVCERIAFTRAWLC